MKEKDKAQRLDSGKLPMHLVPNSAIKALAEVLKFGADKYAERDWEKGMNWSKCYSSLMRHLLKWWEGENNDEESKLEHLRHALANVAFLIEYTKTCPELDDRPKKNKEQARSGYAVTGDRPPETEKPQIKVSKDGSKL